MTKPKIFRGKSKFVTRIEISHGALYDGIAIWTRGEHAGTLTVQPGDGVKIVRLLMPDAKEVDG